MKPNYRLYHYLLASWAALHLEHTPTEYEQAARRIAKLCNV
jgi:hypothetical protein